MDEGRRKVWICLLIIVLAAVVIGILYYLSAPKEQNSEGFLIRQTEDQIRQTEDQIRQTEEQIRHTEEEMGVEQNAG